MIITNIAANTSTIQVHDKTYLKFYDSIVAKIDNNTNEITLGPDWNYSRTTLSRLATFLGQSGATTKQQLAEGIISLDKNLGKEI